MYPFPVSRDTSPSHHDPLIQRKDALDLVCAAISAGIFNDLGSGSNVDACVITASHTEMLRNFVKPNERVQKERTYKFRRGTTEWKKEELVTGRKYIYEVRFDLNLNLIYSNF